MKPRAADPTHEPRGSSPRLPSLHPPGQLETALQVGLLGSPNQMEAVQASMMKRQPDFKDPD